MTNGNDIVAYIIDDNNAFGIFNEWHFCTLLSLILVPQKYLFYHLDQEYCFNSCQFVKYRFCKISAGFRFCVLSVESHEVRGWKLNGWVDLPYNFHNRGGGGGGGGGGHF